MRRHSEKEGESEGRRECEGKEVGEELRGKVDKGVAGR